MARHELIIPFWILHLLECCLYPLQPDGSFFKFGYDAMKEYSKLVDAYQHKKYHYFEKFKMTLYEEKVSLFESNFVI